MKRKYLLVLSSLALLSSCAPKVPSASPKPSTAPSAAQPSEKPKSDRPSSPSASKPSTPSTPSTPTVQKLKVEVNTAEGILDFLSKAGQNHNYTLSMKIRNSDETFVYQYTDTYMVNTNTNSGVVLVDSYDKEATGSDKVLYTFSQDDATGELVLGHAMMNTSKNVPYTDSKAYDVLSSLTLSSGKYNETTYPVAKLKEKSYGFETNYTNFVSLFASLFSAGSVEDYITRFVLTVDEDGTGIDFSCYAKSTGDEFELLTAHLGDVLVTKYDALDLDLVEAKLPEEALNEDDFSSYIGESYAFETDFYMVDDKDNRTLASGVQVSFDGDDFKAVVLDENDDPTGYYHYKDKNNETYYSFVDGYNEVEEALVSQNGQPYAFDEYILAPSEYLDGTLFRKGVDGEYRYLGVHADDIFLALTFNNPSNFGYVDSLSANVSGGLLQSLEFTFTGLSDSSGNAVSVVAVSKAVAASADVEFGPFDNDNPELEAAMESLKTTSFSIKGVGDIDSTIGRLTQRRRADYVYDAAEKRLLVEQYAFDSNKMENYLESRKGYKMVGDVLYMYSLSTKDREDGKYDVLSMGYTDDDDIEAYFPITGSSKVFYKYADNEFASELYCNPTDAFYFGETLTNYYPDVRIKLENGKISEMTAKYVLSSTYSMVCTDKMTFSYEDVTLGEFVE